MIISHGKKLSAIEVGTAGLSHDKSTTLLCSGAEKRKPYRFSRIVLHVLIGQSILTLHVNDLSPEVEERYKELRRRLREQHIVPVRVPSILISAYSHETLHGLKLSCDSFYFISDKEADKEGEPCQRYPFDGSMDDTAEDTEDLFMNITIG